jgi:hypothetical protein
MSSFSSVLDAMNSAVLLTFGAETISYQQQANGSPIGSPVPLQAIPIDPLRLEGLANGNFAVRWVRKVDLIDWTGTEALVPAKGDVVTLIDSELTTGGVYTLIQIQEDIGGGIRLVLERRS